MPHPITFDSLGLNTPLLRAIRERNYIEPTAIQRAAIPVILSGSDIRASAQTGSGKTAAFALPILQKLLLGTADTTRSTRALILAPTRELAMQIGVEFKACSRYLTKPLKILTAFGGVSINPQMMALRGGADIVIATPGRLLDLVDHNALRLTAVNMLVLDEADRLLDLGFADELGRILQMLPASRQTMLFSATFPEAVNALAERCLREPTHIDIAATVSSEPAITQRAIAVDTARRTQLLRHLIQEHSWARVLVFVATKYATEHVAEKLRRMKIRAEAFHGELSQGARIQALADFKASTTQVLIATDVAARGIDIAQLPVVVNYDLPRSAVDYVHRIGRTGRAGESGLAVSFITADSEAHFRLIEKRNHFNLPREQLPGFEPTEVASTGKALPNQETVPGTGGIKGKRKSKKDKLREASALATDEPVLVTSSPWDVSKIPKR